MPLVSARNVPLMLIDAHVSLRWHRHVSLRLEQDCEILGVCLPAHCHGQGGWLVLLEAAIRDRILEVGCRHGQVQIHDMFVAFGQALDWRRPQGAVP